MKSKLVVPRNQAREMVPGPDLDRMLNSGSYLLATVPNKPTAHCIAQKEYMQRRLDAGFKKLQVLLPEPIFNKLRERCRDGESMAELLERLLSASDNDQISTVGAHN
ncbi:hypothetical protein [Pseudomonas sp. Irchel 3A7]|uniref:hypothetical protein n=1 Tax=Pseudomonas sp. Irchel 3A7 TaxID=2008913 RepID=UPI00113FF210|nr:hypothetical protein [Pseudomonas sp. Irchel 3A7]